MKKPWKKVSIKWLDAVGGSEKGWQDIDEVMKEVPHRCTTPGYVINEGPDFVTIAQTISQDPVSKKWQVNGWICVPKAWTNLRKNSKGKGETKPVPLPVDAPVNTNIEELK